MRTELLLTTMIMNNDDCHGLIYFRYRGDDVMDDGIRAEPSCGMTKLVARARGEERGAPEAGGVADACPLRCIVSGLSTCLPNCY